MVQKTIWRAVRMVLGFAFLGLGVVGLFLPFLQGILFIIIGLTLLGRESSRARHILGWIRGRLSVRKTQAGRAMQSEGVNDAG